nr:MAG TPA: hypothetical protein [Caudoviricetes sp.]
MRTMLLNLREDVSTRVFSGEKAMNIERCSQMNLLKSIHISSPMKAICVVIYLSNKTPLTDW